MLGIAFLGDARRHEPRDRNADREHHGTFGLGAGIPTAIGSASASVGARDGVRRLAPGLGDALQLASSFPAALRAWCGGSSAGRFGLYLVRQHRNHAPIHTKRHTTGLFHDKRDWKRRFGRHPAHHTSRPVGKIIRRFASSKKPVSSDSYQRVSRKGHPV
jgi:hypothetical protein